MYYSQELKFPIESGSTNSYGRVIRTVSDTKLTQNFTLKFCQELQHQLQTFGANFTHKTDDQITFLTFVEDALLNAIGSENKCNIFSDLKDHLKRPMRRYVVELGKDRRYLVDAHAILDVKLVMSRAKRFWLTHIPRIFSKVDSSKFVPKIKYQVKIWTTPINYLIIEFVEVSMPVEYSSRIEQMRELVGYPDYYELKEKSLYERTDFDIRRALFNECTDVFKK